MIELSLVEIVFVFLLVGFIMCGGYFYRYRAGRCRSNKRMNGKVVLVTGATAGIGKYTALDLAKRGAKVILGCRNLVKAKATVEWINEQCDKAEVVYFHLDLSDLDSVRRFSEEVVASETKIDVLINNAGIGSPSRKESPQGFELTLATNHYGHFLLTHLLLGLLRAAPSARIINVSSEGHRYGGLDLNDMHFKERSYGVTAGYCQSKLCNVLFTNEISARLKDQGITANSLHPGLVDTEIFNKEESRTKLGAFMSRFAGFFGKTVEQGAQTSIYLAVADEVANVSGEYFSDCRVKSMSNRAKDVVLARKLWELTEEEVNLPDHLKI